MGKLILGRQNEILNTTGISLVDQKLTPVYVPDEIKKKINVKVFNLMLVVNETRFLFQH